MLGAKRKNQKGKTIKKRIQVDAPFKVLNTDHRQFIKDRLKQDHQLLYCHTNFFNRITMVNRFLKERITIDFDLRFENEKNTIKDETNQIVIAEVKQETLDRTSFFYKLMKNYKESAYSDKYSDTPCGDAFIPAAPFFQFAGHTSPCSSKNCSASIVRSKS